MICKLDLYVSNWIKVITTIFYRHGQKKDSFTEIVIIEIVIDQNYNKFYKYILKYIYVHYL